jgi:excisionase family DNA binding protein
MVIKSHDELPATLTVNETAAVLRISRRTVRRLEQLGKLNGSRLSARAVRFQRDDVLALLGEQKMACA